MKKYVGDVSQYAHKYRYSANISAWDEIESVKESASSQRQLAGNSEVGVGNESLPAARAQNNASHASATRAKAGAGFETVTNKCSSLSLTVPQDASSSSGCKFSHIARYFRRSKGEHNLHWSTERHRTDTLPCRLRRHVTTSV